MKCAEILGISQSSVNYLMKKYNISARNNSEIHSSKTIISMTEDMYSILRGAILGDGSLKIEKNGINASFSYTSKSYQHVYYVVKDFLKYGSGNGIINNDIYDERTDKSYHKYQFRTVASPTLTEEYYKWYINKIKHIPKELVLNSLMCKVWYLGDGCLRNSHHNTQDIILCTNCFKKEEIEEILLPQLSSFNAELYKAADLKNGEESYTIRIGKKDDIKRFLDYIGDCPFDDYKYKWDIKPKLLNGTQGKYNRFAHEWIELYKSDNTISNIARMYNATDNAVENTLRNHWII